MQDPVNREGHIKAERQSSNHKEVTMLLTAHHSHVTLFEGHREETGFGSSTHSGLASTKNGKQTSRQFSFTVVYIHHSLPARLLLGKRFTLNVRARFVLSC